MTFDRTNLMLITIAVLGMVLAFVVVFHVGRERHALKESGEVEPPLAPGHEETLHVGSSISPEEREKLSKERKEAGGSIPAGELRWKPKTAEKKKPGEGRSTYDLDEEVIKPKAEDGSAVR